MIVHKKTDKKDRHQVSSNGNEWQQITASGTKNDSEWQRMTSSGTTNDNEWYNEWERVIQ